MTSRDGYAVLRESTVAWLLDGIREAGLARDVPEEVARDLGSVVGHLRAPEPEERLRALGPVLSAEEHVQLLEEDSSIGLPGGNSGDFWRLVVKVTHAVLSNEGEAVLKLIGGRGEEG